MNATQQLHDLGQRIWLDNIGRALPTSGALSRYIRELAVTGLTSNPAIFDHAIQRSHCHDDAIGRKALLAIAEHGKGKGVMPIDEGYAEPVLAEFTREGVIDEALAADLQRQGIAAFAESWRQLTSRIASKRELLTAGRS